MASSELDILVGEQLSAVSFVQDYVEFHFDGPVLRALRNPLVQTPHGRWQFPWPGSRDALCEPIGRDVLSVRFETGARIQLELEGGYQLTIPLDLASYRGPEAAHFIANGQFGVVE